MTITDLYLYPYLIIIGGSILAASFWLLYLYRKQALRGQELIKLNERLGYDLPDFLKSCWPSLQSGGFTGIWWRLDWFGVVVSGESGRTRGHLEEKHLQVREISLQTRLYFEHRGWEQQHFRAALSDTFFLLVRMNMWTKVGAVQGAFDQTAKMAVFLQHDLKNLVQLMSLSVDQLEQTTQANEQRLLATLRETMPAVRDRAQHMLDAIASGTALKDSNSGKTTEFNLETLLRDTASVYHLNIHIDGTATLRAEPLRLQGIIDNLLSNYRQHALDPEGAEVDLYIQIHADAKLVTLLLQDRNGQPYPRPERLFEPFWSEKGAGLGIGLYQARHHATELGGNLNVKSDLHQPLQFILKLPVNM